ncbi:MAG: enoyl-CoA hydratase/isomerase family protein [Solirubrobacterales bacterium]
MSTYEEMIRSGTDAEHEAVLVERPAGDRAIVTMNEPEHLNALSAAVCVQLDRVLAELADDRDLRTIVLTGAGTGFSAGGDLEMMETATEGITQPAGSTDVWRWIRNRFGAVVRRIARTDKAFVAAVNGPAAGVGLAFALTCDLAIASERAILVPAFGRLGLLPEVGTSWALTRRLGYQGAFAFFASGEHVDAAEAERLGLVQEVVPHDRLLPAANEWADRIAALAPHALEMAKPLLRATADASWDTALTMEEFAEPNCFTTERFAAAVAAMRGHGGP